MGRQAIRGATPAVPGYPVDGFRRDGMERRRWTIPDWLVGLVLALLLVVAAFAVFDIGDDPSVPTGTSETPT